MALIDQVLATAAAEVGVREKGANWGPRVKEYLAACEISFPAAWCAAFCRWVFDRVDRPGFEAVLAGIRRRDFAYTPFIDAWARREGVLENQPQKGDLFLYYSGGRARHVGIVESVLGPAFRTLEGNTNEGGSPEGIGVFRRNRLNGPAYRFVRWADLATETPAVLGERTLVLSGTPRFPCKVIDGRTWAPVRKWAQALGFKLDWDASTQTVKLNGKELDADVVLLEGVGYAPVRDLARSAGLRVLHWDGYAVSVGR